MIDTSNIVGNTLSWIVVKDFKSAIRFYTEVLGFSIQSETPEYGWAELSGPEGAIVALAQENPSAPYKAGINAIITITVKDINTARRALFDAGTKLHGEIEEIPGHVKMQTFEDADGNILQLAEKLSN